MPLSVSEQSSEKIYSVIELNRKVKHLLNTSVPELWLSGEISNVTIKSDSGHVYFNIKDSEAQISAVYWRGAAAFTSLSLQQGSKIEAFGRVDLYDRGGAFQFSVIELRPVGLGELFRRLEELKTKLRNEGLFDISRKKAVPFLPRCIGLVTSLEGAAIRDFMQILFRRHPNIHVRIINSPVQGTGAAEWLAAAVKYFDQSASVDVIVITRGGGSIEDLWEFNSEILAREIAVCTIPVISAVGHERDFTICDEVADFRASTPSAAAELVVKGQLEIQDALQNNQRRLYAALQTMLNARKIRWQRAERCSFFQRPMDLTNRMSQRLDTAILRLAQRLKIIAERTKQKILLTKQRLPVALQKNLQLRKNRLANCAIALNALDPHKVLSRGYCILLNENKKAIRAVEQVEKDEILTGILSEGELKLTVKEKNNDCK